MAHEQGCILFSVDNIVSHQGCVRCENKCMQVQRFDDGERQHYFADDDRQKLSDLVAQQRYEGAADMDANLADNIVRKGKRFR